ncbi:3-oxoacyl-[acyl-carrier-protein] synthase 3 [Zhongshania aliphaticivorans]|uniref:3-oxoacyl-[acyl-carrier-protein] synthase 3 n=1 Tax=Zhongshania aliphaticivorans TaxID=1470434 RepID=A0A5S9PQ90_9GAMM|nr:beta-ketoacyl-ACP synthase III [Zhongshania aliphaticivorans]CAA0106510.1 3-oxoacyl-[acyl-carrier-protein] synthase 3 [Zhongshania aliphaticivorans]CAA0106669.1 3-oxoacyl-[acyl-carrier-protein] synthase 3 [Zhongshania aliphaticivorans]
MSDNAVYITDISAFLPNPPVTNDQMERILGQVGNRTSRARRLVLRANGIRSRHYAIDPETLAHNYSNADMTAKAIDAITNPQWTLDELNCLSCGTSIPDQLMPNHAVMVQGQLKLRRCEVIATSGVCLSGITALKYAYMGVLSGVHQNAIATGSDLSSASMKADNFSHEIEANVDNLEKQPELAFEKDFLRWMLSDGAGAMLLRNQPASQGLSLRINWLDIISYAGEVESCMYAGAVKNEDGTLTGWQSFSPQQCAENSIMAVKQDVKLLNDNIIEYTVKKPLLELQDKYSLKPDSIDWFVPHYSSAFFRKKLLAGLKSVDFDIPMSRWFTNLATKGNTGAASIYIMLEELFRSGKLKAGQNILCYIPESGRFSTSFLHLTVV